MLFSNLASFRAEKIPFYLRGTFSRQLKFEMKDMVDEFILQVTGYFAGNKIHSEHQTILRPRDWWQMFKSECMPQWFVQKFPIRYETITLETKFIHICPHLEIPYPEDKYPHFEFLMHPRDRWR